MTLFTVEDQGQSIPPPESRGPATPGRIVGAIATTIVVGAIAAAGAWALLNAQRVTDQFTVWNFSPSAALREYVERSTMTGEGEFLFLASTPRVHADGEFDTVCSSHQEDVGILGCYLPSEKTIHLYDVTDDRLTGLEEVIAAHEMLHAAWDRMSADEQDALEPLLEAEAEKLADNADFTERMAFYAVSEPGERANELHSIIGTEIEEIGPELEAHYATYFSDRQALVALHVASDAVFVDLQARSEALVASLEALRASVEADYAAYNAGYDRLNDDIESFNEKADSGGFGSRQDFDDERTALLGRQAELDALYVTIQSRTAEYEAGIAELDSLNAQVTDLNSSINIRPREDGM